MAQSEAGIASIALLHLGRDPIVSFDDLNSSHSGIMKARYPAVRDALLRTYPWNFAMKYISLAGVALPSPMFDYNYKCPLPAGGDELPYCLKLWQVDTTEEYNVAGRDLFIKCAPPIKVAYVFREENPEVYDPLFAELAGIDLALTLFSKLATTEVSKQRRSLERTRTGLRRQAVLSDAMEQGFMKLVRNNGTGSWANARRPL